MELSAPKNVTFIVAIIIAIIGVLTALGSISFVPLASVWIVTIAFVVLALGCLLKDV